MKKKKEQVFSILNNEFGLQNKNLEIADKICNLFQPKPKTRPQLKNTYLKDINVYNLPEQDQLYYRTAKAFLDMINENLKLYQINNEHLINAKYGHWVNPIRLMITKDNRSIEAIREVFKFLQGHEFWAVQIQSTAKLRQKFQTLHSQQKQNERQNSKNTAKVSTNYLKSVFRDLQS